MGSRVTKDNEERPSLPQKRTRGKRQGAGAAAAAKAKKKPKRASGDKGGNAGSSTTSMPANLSLMEQAQLEAGKEACLDLLKAAKKVKDR